MAVLSRLAINDDRLNRSLFQLAEIGKLSNGGTSRVAFSTEDLLARQLVQSWMVEAGMTVRIDAAGNIIARYAGLRDEAAALATDHTLIRFQLQDDMTVAWGFWLELKWLES